MELYVLLFSSCLLLVEGGRLVRQAEEPTPTYDCKVPPENPERITCCSLPRSHIFGDIKASKRSCAMKLEEKYAEQREGEEGPSPSPSPSPEGRYMRRRHWHLLRNGCFPECIFEREGFLVDGKVDKQALLDRVEDSLSEEKEWQGVAMTAVDKCTSTELELNVNDTCRSGSAETLNCIFRELFLECPFWLGKNEFCSTLREFHEQCPDAQPPHMFGRRRHHNYHHRNEEPPMPEAEPTDKNEPQVSE